MRFLLFALLVASVGAFLPQGSRLAYPTRSQPARRTSGVAVEGVSLSPRRGDVR